MKLDLLCQKLSSGLTKKVMVKRKIKELLCFEFGYKDSFFAIQSSVGHSYGSVVQLNNLFSWISCTTIEPGLAKRKKKPGLPPFSM